MTDGFRLKECIFNGEVTVGLYPQKEVIVITAKDDDSMKHIFLDEHNAKQLANKLDELLEKLRRDRHERFIREEF